MENEETCFKQLHNASKFRSVFPYRNVNEITYEAGFGKLVVFSPYQSSPSSVILVSLCVNIVCELLFKFFVLFCFLFCLFVFFLTNVSALFMERTATVTHKAQKTMEIGGSLESFCD